MITAPLLSAVCRPDQLDNLRYPVLCTPKIDGIRTLKLSGKALSRTFAEVPNRKIAQAIEGLPLDMLDGEFTIPGASFSTASGVWRSRQDSTSHPASSREWLYSIFDFVAKPDEPYQYRLYALGALMERTSWPDWCKVLYPVSCRDSNQVLAYEERCLTQGYEGVMIRTPSGKYKQGRSTFNEQTLLKLKRFADAEAVVVGFEELRHNENALERDAFGHAKRRECAVGLVGSNTLGALKVRGLGAWAGVEFNIGTGFTAKDRACIWENKRSLELNIVKFRYQEIGVKDAPRFPRFVGFRAREDM